MFDTPTLHSTMVSILIIEQQLKRNDSTNISTQRQSSGRVTLNIEACVFQSLHAPLFFQTFKPLDHFHFQNQLPLWLRLLRNLSHLENLIYMCDRLRNKSQKIQTPNLLHRYLKHRRLYLQNRLVKERIKAGYQVVY